MKMNPYKIYEFVYYAICLFGFLLFYIFREHIKRTKSYPNTIRNYGVKLSKSDKKNENLTASILIWGSILLLPASLALEQPWNLESEVQ